MPRSLKHSRDGGGVLAADGEGGVVGEDDLLAAVATDFGAGDDERAMDAQKAKVLTNHPASSYRIIDRDGKKVLHITSPADFWSLTNYLVVQQD